MKMTYRSSSETNDSLKDDVHKLLEYIPQINSIFNVLGKIGEGTFSKVFKATIKSENEKMTSQEYALKYLIPTSHPSRISNELCCLKELGGTDNIIGVEMCFMERGHVVIVMPYFHHDKFQDYVKTMTVDEIRDYMKNLFCALNKVHSQKIIHRDIKPSNFLYYRTDRRYALVDFGLAQQLTCSTNTSECETYQGNYCEGNVKKKRKLTDQENENVSKSPGKKYQATSINNSKVLQPISLNTQLPQQRIKVHQIDSKSSKILFSHNLDNKLTKSRIDKLKVAGRISNGCSCYGKQEVCQICLNRVQEVAPRAGTPGFRAPEVLLKYKNQTTAVDMWAAGVIFLSLLTKKYPFFRSSDDLGSLAEITCIVGSKRIQQAALCIGKRVFLSMQKPKADLKLLCEKLRSYHISNDIGTSVDTPTAEEIPESAYHLLGRLLDPNPITRITASQAYSHPFNSI